jgi:hypothetical protein
MFDAKAMQIVGERMAAQVRDFCARTLEPYVQRLRALEDRLAGLPMPQNGKDADPDFIRALVKQEFEAWPKPQDGKSVDVVELAGQITAAAAKAVEALPKPAAGKDADPAHIELLVQRAALALPRPIDGKSVEPAEVEAMVRRAVAALPKPENGKDADADVIASNVLGKVMKALEAIPAPEDGKPGKDADPEVVRATIATEVERVLATWDRPQDGKSVDLVQLSGEIVAAAVKAVEALPKPRNGKDYDPAELEAAVKRAVAALPPAASGKDADPALVAELVAKSVGALPLPDFEKLVQRAIEGALPAEVAKAVGALPKPEVIKGDPGKDADPAVMQKMVADAVAALPKPADGKSVDQDQVREMVEHAVAQLPKPRDGEDADPEVTRALVERLFADMPKPQDGKSVTVDEVLPLFEAQFSKWALDFERRATDVQQRAIERMPKPENGTDGLGFDDLTFSHDGLRTGVFRFSRGDQVKEFTFKTPAVVDCGVYAAGSVHEKGDGVTYGGAFYIAKRDTNTSPGDGDGSWRRAVNSGRDRERPVRARR